MCVGAAAISERLVYVDEMKKKLSLKINDGNIRGCERAMRWRVGCK